MSPARIKQLIPLAAALNLAAQIGIVVTGGAVRLTGSGLGCSTWPNCEPGQFTPQVFGASDWHGAIEFGNRALALIVFVVAVALAVLLLLHARRDPAHARRGVTALGVGIAAGVLIQAVVGGMTVWFELHPALVGSHFLLSGALIAASAYLVARWQEGDRPARSLAIRPALPVRRVGTLLGLVAVVLVVLGVVVTGAGPHSGDEEVGYRFAVDPVAVARVHAGAVWVFTSLLAALLVLLHRARALPGGEQELTRARRMAWALLGVTAAQGFIGYVQYFTGLPELLVGMHLFGAAVLVAATVLTLTTLRVREHEVAPAAPTEQPETAPRP